MTKKLYDLDAYEVEFDAEVISCETVEEKERTVYHVLLDQTLFFPEEGGQSPDKGIIGDCNVLDVQIKDDIIIHTVDAPMEVGTFVHGRIDWKHRFNNMQQHSGEHIFSGTVHRKFGYDNVGFHLSDNIVTMDFNGVITEQEAAEIEYEVNEIITKNLPVQVTFPSKEELAHMEYRSKIEIEGQVRIVTIPDVDVCACCAPHVKQTGEIGMLKIMSLQSHRGGVRISILCGFRALEAFREKDKIVTTLSNAFSTNQEKLPELIEKMQKSNQDLKYQLAEAKQKLMALKMSEIPDAQEDVIFFESGLDTPVMRNVVNELVAAHKGICGIFVGTEEEGYNFIIGSSTRDCSKIAAILREKTGARGGGSPQMIQGSIKAHESDIREILQGKLIYD